MAASLLVPGCHCNSSVCGVLVSEAGGVRLHSSGTVASLGAAPFAPLLIILWIIVEMTCLFPLCYMLTETGYVVACTPFTGWGKHLFQFPLTTLLFVRSQRCTRVAGLGLGWLSLTANTCNSELWLLLTTRALWLGQACVLSLSVRHLTEDSMTLGRKTPAGPTHHLQEMLGLWKLA